MKNLVILLLAISPVSGYSQKILDVVALSDGKVIVVYDNKTWKYTDEIKSTTTTTPTQSFAPVATKTSDQETKPNASTIKKPSTTPIRYAPASNSTSSQCTARTQKGTRCKRMVKGGGRCWQHS